jgi:transposase-like protein
MTSRRLPQRGETNRSYSDEFRGLAIAKLQHNDGNVKGTARELGMPWQTLRSWKKQFEKYQNQEDTGPSMNRRMVEAIEKAGGDFTDRAELVRDQALTKIQTLIPLTTEKNLTALINLTANLTDRIDRARGLAERTTNVEHHHEIHAPELAKALADYASLVRDESLQRQQEIIDVEVLEQSFMELEASM